MFIEATTSHLTEEDQSIIDDRFDGIVFHRCFPYHLSKVAILYQFKGIISSNPLGGYFSNENLVSFITKTIEQTEKSDAAKKAGKLPHPRLYEKALEEIRQYQALLRNDITSADFAEALATRYAESVHEE